MKEGYEGTVPDVIASKPNADKAISRLRDCFGYALLDFVNYIGGSEIVQLGHCGYGRYIKRIKTIV
mgnify:CR=1 FL=1